MSENEKSVACDTTQADNAHSYLYFGRTIAGELVAVRRTTFERARMHAVRAHGDVRLGYSAAVSAWKWVKLSDNIRWTHPKDERPAIVRPENVDHGWKCTCDRGRTAARTRMPRVMMTGPVQRLSWHATDVSAACHAWRPAQLNSWLLETRSYNMFGIIGWYKNAAREL